jgi:hypothetical protein
MKGTATAFWSVVRIVVGDMAAKESVKETGGGDDWMVQAFSPDRSA